MKITYYYNEYKDFPEATRISESRAFLGFILSGAAICFLILSVVLMFSYPEDLLSGIVCVILALSACVYMFNRYPKVTERKIEQAIHDSLTQKERLASSRHQCKKIDVSSKRIKGTCNVCYEKEQELTFCTIKQDSGTRSIYVCSECISKFLGKDYKKIQELRKQISEMEAALNEHDQAYIQNKPILAKAYSDDVLGKMVADGEFPADRVQEYIQSRESLRAFIATAPLVRESMVKMISNLKEDLSRLTAEI